MVIPKDDVFDYYQEVARSAFADMLHDTERNRKYAIGLEKSIQLMKSRGKPANVLDIGTGTGLLAMLASRYGADSVVTLEAFSPVSYVARKVIEENGFKDKIKIVNKHSTLVRVGPGLDMESKANILVAEVFDTELIGEGAIKTYKHALENLMEKDCLAVPEMANIYVQIVDCDAVVAWNTFKDMQNFKCPENVTKCAGNPAIHDLQLSQLSTDKFKILTEPTKICEFDFTGKKKIPYNETFTTPMKVLQNGQANAAFFWWDIKMCADDLPVLSCAPFWAHPDFTDSKVIEKARNSDDKICNLIPWRDHWMQGCFHLNAHAEVLANSNLTLQSSHDEFSWWFNVTQSPATPPASVKPACTCIFHITTSRNRIMQINSVQRRDLYRKVLQKYCDNDDEVILFLGDNSFLPFDFATTKSRKFLLQENPLCYRSIKNFLDNNGGTRVNVIGDLSEIDDEKITRIISEPHFDSSILPWQSIVELRTKIRQFHNVSVNPISARIHALPVHFLHLHKIRWPLKSSCEGFDHKTFDEVIDFASELADENVEPFTLWEYPCRALGKSQDIFNLSFLDDADKTIVSSKSTLSVERKNECCNGIAFWMEWQIDENVFSSSGPENDEPSQIGELIRWKMEERQAVHLIPASKVESKNGRIDKISITTCLKDEQMSMEFSYIYSDD